MSKSESYRDALNRKALIEAGYSQPIEFAPPGPMRKKGKKLLKRLRRKAKKNDSISRARVREYAREHLIPFFRNIDRVFNQIKEAA